jgi:hypothetical protein
MVAMGYGISAPLTNPLLLRAISVSKDSKSGVAGVDI